MSSSLDTIRYLLNHQVHSVAHATGSQSEGSPIFPNLDGNSCFGALKGTNTIITKTYKFGSDVLRCQTALIEQSMHNNIRELVCSVAIKEAVLKDIANVAPFPNYPSRTHVLRSKKFGPRQHLTSSTLIEMILANSTSIQHSSKLLELKHACAQTFSNMCFPTSVYMKKISLSNV